MNLELIIVGKRSADPIEVPCSQCGVLFTTTKREVQKRIRLGSKTWCCSKTCSYNLRKHLLPKACKQCGAEFNPTSSKQIYCTLSCSGVANSTGVRRHGTGKYNNKYGTRDTYNGLRREELDKAALYKLENGLFTDSQRATISKYLIKFDGRRCSICGITEWCGQPVPIVVDHIDGNADNNFKSNLRLVCANCDRQLPTSKGKNRGFGRKNRRR